MIDTPKQARYRAALLTLAATLLALWAAPRPAVASEYKLDLGATLPRWAKKIGPHRYRSPWDWEGTKKWLDRTYGRWEYPRIRIVNKPGIKAFHLRNRKRKGQWVGINVYQLATGEVRFFVVERPPKKKKKGGGTMK